MLPFIKGGDIYEWDVKIKQKHLAGGQATPYFHDISSTLVKMFLMVMKIKAALACTEVSAGVWLGLTIIADLYCGSLLREDLFSPNKLFCTFLAIVCYLPYIRIHVGLDLLARTAGLSRGDP